MSTLRSSLSALANRFADEVLAAIRGASIEDLLGEAKATPRRGPGRPRGAGTRTSKAKTRNGRLARRSSEQIAKAVEQVVALVRKSKTGLRAEEIKTALGLDRREVPRILKTAVAGKKLKSKGQKRATTYSAR